MKTLTLIALLSALSGCATCERYPVACTVAGAFVVGSVAYTLEMNDSSHRDPHNSFSQDHGRQLRPSAPMRGIQPPLCANGSCQ
jgi:hypothetical protein